MTNDPSQNQSVGKSAATRYVVRFTGRVQGVGFRATAIQLARDLDVHGYVRNEPDGSVRLDADGPRGDLDELVERIESRMSGCLSGTAIDRHPSQNRTGGLKIRY